MGFPATDRGGSLEAQRYYGSGRPLYWLSVQGGWADRSKQIACPLEIVRDSFRPIIKEGDMAKRIKSESELKAWDAYFSAALEQARRFANGGSNEKLISNQIKIAAEIADEMLDARFLRDHVE